MYGLGMKLIGKLFEKNGKRLFVLKTREYANRPEAFMLILTEGKAEFITWPILWSEFHEINALPDTTYVMKLD